MEHVNSLKEILPNFVAVGIGLSRQARRAVLNLAEKHGTHKIYTDGKLAQFKMPPQYQSRYQTVRKHQRDHAIFAGLLPKMSLVSLVSLYDAFLRRLIFSILNIQPEILNGSSKQLTFSALTSYSSIDEARRDIIEQEIDSLLRESHSVQIEWIERKLNLSLTAFQNWKNFIELTERRNLLVHADGVVGKQYIEVCKRFKVNLPNDLKVGDSLSIDSDYYLKSCDLIAEICVKLTQVVWRKLLPQEIEIAEKSYIKSSFILLVAKEYHLAEQILQLSNSPKFEMFNNESKLYILINFAIAYKGQGKDAECRALLNTDFSSYSLKFRLAQAALLENYEKAAYYMKKIGSEDEEIGASQYEKWPLFLWFRNTTEFSEAYKEIFGCEFSAEEEVRLEDVFSDDPEDIFAEDPDDSTASVNDENR